jgi:hypothetical protein
LGKNVIIVSDGHAFHITSYDGTSVCRTEIKSIESTQEALQPLRFRSIDFMEFSRYLSVLKRIYDFLTTISNSLAQTSLKLGGKSSPGNSCSK